MLDNRHSPGGTVTFLFTDIEGSTSRWQAEPEAMSVALPRHDALVRGAIERRGGSVFATMGDGMAAVFDAASAAVEAAVAIQADLGGEVWPDSVGELRVRVGVHTGEAIERGGDWFGPAVNRTARVMAVGHGGQVLLSGVTATLIGDRWPLLDLGEHRLKDLLAAEHVWQVDHDGVAHRPLRSLGRVGTQLPIQLTPFVGREAELAATSAALDEARAVTITGVGGMGKTRLALQVAAERADRHAQGVWFVDLAPLTAPDAVVGAVASVLGVEKGASPALLDALAQALESRDTLLVVDNCEHVLDAVAATVAELLRRCPSVRVLATSREGLGIAGERVMPVGPLGADRDAIVLFASRARDQRPDLAIDDSTLAIMRDICSRLDGIPLALELAAARVRSMTLDELAARLDERFRLLTRGTRGAVSRHQTLQATVDWSYQLLNDPQRRVLERVSVFAGGFVLDAAEEVAADGTDVDALDVIDLLDDLVRRSLLIADQRTGATRYRVLETIRQFAADRLAERPEAEEVRDRHVTWMVSLVERTGEEFFGPHDLVWIGRLTDELDNHAVAVERARSGERLDRLVRLHDPVSIGFAFGLRLAAALAESAARAVSDPAVLGRPEVRAPLEAWAAYDAFARADYAAGVELGRRSRSVDPWPGRWPAQPHMGSYCCRVFSGDIDGALEESSVALAASLDEGEVAMWEGAWSMALSLAGRADEAIPFARRAVEAARQSRSVTQQANMLMHLGVALDVAGAPEATEVLAECLRLATRAGIVFTATAAAGAASSRQGAGGEDTTALLSIIDAAVESGSPSAVAQALRATGTVLGERGDPALGAKLLGATQRWLPLVYYSQKLLLDDDLADERERGRGLSLDEAVDLARRALEAPTPGH